MVLFDVLVSLSQFRQGGGGSSRWHGTRQAVQLLTVEGDQGAAGVSCDRCVHGVSSPKTVLRGQSHRKSSKKIIYHHHDRGACVRKQPRPRWAQG